MKLYYVANVRIPTEKAHGIQIMKMCEAFARQGFDVELIVPRRFTQINSNPFEYYSTKSIFSIKKMPCIDLVRYGKWGFYVQAISFALSAFFYVMFTPKAVIFGRDEQSLMLVSFFRQVAWETHTSVYNQATKVLLRMKPFVVTITHGLENFYISKGFNSKNIFVSPDGVDERLFGVTTTKYEARSKLGIPLGKKVVLYTGHLYDWKGAHTLARASQDLPEDVLVYFVGGTEGDIKSFKEQFGAMPNIRILGKKPYAEIPLYLKSADVLVIPNSAKSDISNLYTSPMKLFEYMEGGVPIVASSIPSIREIIDDSSAFFCSPDDSVSLSDAIMRVLANNEEAQKKAIQARIIVKNYTWEKRARNILDFIKVQL
ncbi:MAG: Glycosyl transferase, group 1 family protein [Parcubacteria group bacterium GW2011_GWC1_42_11]|uniref:Glycosyl transferase, group 1 family protein n=1 Tax=Candidatus Nomurabacteria bacterium GW2011_GWC2_42_20 TaxID=1618756 RepID=A0A0G0ZGT1_9BACT|nr:MAG: Glycosyl transferase, group 1 family protein [Parcubacteria group bacterium GW2011_GWC1_42_11]KKS47922.1 MAG: Glycosyl transferase, group 1 family protein [Candidatus Nomurabacteria bacterium GW2011_GWC2_42_20]KKS59094.1 MAG: Glycosyl transferase, group 1 family protein [Candidatus Nomurabacteria bacterium GW2011_GWA2_42_41]KKT09689.1 MAG: Glycosyl transferase, group 1 family protein [Candidatus Nomurabacteria bacterium GW2011_GWB1_43_20]TAN36627.1 MAG: glycosyltransferase [Patescibacte